MTSTRVRVASLIVAIAACQPATGRSQAKVASWLDEPTPAAWNTSGLRLPAAPQVRGGDPRCRELVRPPQLEEDKRVLEQGWDLVGAFQGGWQVLVIRGTSGYDGMCRPLQYQGFVFVRGMFRARCRRTPWTAVQMVLSAGCFFKATAG
jgi:hypothetical protein